MDEQPQDGQPTPGELLEAMAAGLLAPADPLSLATSIARVGSRFVDNPGAAAASMQSFAADLAAPPEEPATRDRRFADPAWRENPGFAALLHQYRAFNRLLLNLPAAAGLQGAEADKARFALQLVADAAAPTNFLATNPAALKRALETGGESVRKGLANLTRDLAENGGMPQQVDSSAFVVGRDLAATPGKVVFRNALMELIQYAPQTKQTRAVPLLMSPPWINKYYIMDLAPGKSFIEHAVRAGHTTFAISYRNPDASFREIGLDDYLADGIGTAYDTVLEITGAETANVVGLCLGGTLAAMHAAHRAARGLDGPHTLTLLNSLLDFAEPGPLAVFTDPASVERLERKMADTGYLDKTEMASSFNLLRANDLIWSYVASSWLMGEDPPAFDILAWNADSTRMPAKMHTTYLRTCYLENQLAKGTLEAGGERLDLGAIGADAYVVGAADDHITPWASCFAATRLLGGDVRYVLTSSGHIAGIVNPPGPKRKHWTDGPAGAEADAWREAASEHVGSWWDDWVPWIAARAGDEQAPPKRLGSKAHPPLDDAPGTYVHEQ